MSIRCQWYAQIPFSAEICVDLSQLIAFALHYLCLHPEYIEPIRAEIVEIRSRGQEPATADSAPLMDSFLRETARLQTINARRKSQRPISSVQADQASVQIPHKTLSKFIFKDGTVVPAGNWVCIPSCAIMQDEAIYSDARAFNPRRFLNKDGKVKSGFEFTTPSPEFWYWGGSKRPW